MFKKGRKHPQVNDKQSLHAIYCHLADDSRSIGLKLGAEEVRVRVIDEVEGDIFVAFRQQDRDLHELRPNQVVNIVFYHEGKEYYGGMRVMGIGKYEKQEAVRLQIPTMLNIKDEFGLTEFHVSPRKEVTFTSMFNQFCTGALINIGADGVDIINQEGTATRQLLNVDREVDVAFELSPELRIYNKGRVLYINQVGEELIGIRFLKMPDKTKNEITAWIAEQAVSKRNADAAFLRDRLAGGGKRKRKQDGDGEAKPKGIRLLDDFETVLHEGEPRILLLCRDEAMIGRIAKCLKRKYGVLISKGRYRNVSAILEHYEPDLVLVSEHLDTISGLDLVGTIRERLHDAPPMLVLGGAEETSQVRAISKGALDFCSIEPFQPLALFKKVQETFAMLQPEEEEPEEEKPVSAIREKIRAMASGGNTPAKAKINAAIREKLKAEISATEGSEQPSEEDAAQSSSSQAQQ